MTAAVCSGFMSYMRWHYREMMITQPSCAFNKLPLPLTLLIKSSTGREDFALQFQDQTWPSTWTLTFHIFTWRLRELRGKTQNHATHSPKFPTLREFGNKPCISVKLASRWFRKGILAWAWGHYLRLGKPNPSPILKTGILSLLLAELSPRSSWTCWTKTGLRCATRGRNRYLIPQSRGTSPTSASSRMASARPPLSPPSQPFRWDSLADKALFMITNSPILSIRSHIEQMSYFSVSIYLLLDSWRLSG